MVAAVTDSTFSRNVSRGVYGGGALCVDGFVTVTNSTFSRNSLIQNGLGGGDSGGGAIWVFNGPNTVTGSTFSRNRVSAKAGSSVAGGGAIYCDECDLNVNDSTFSYNSSVNGSAGGAIAHTAGGDLVVMNSMFFRNSVSGGVKIGTIFNNGGGALYDNGRLTVTNSTFSGNAVSVAGKGGAILEGFGQVTVTNSTFSRNRGGGAGGGGGIAVADQADGGQALLQNTIVANSTRGGNCAGMGIVDGGHNLRWPSKDTTCVGYIGDPKVAPLKNNGGPTKTMALRPGSAAINAGDNAICAAAPVNNLDQRGFVRPAAGITNCSIGAYEYNAVAAP